MNRPILITGVAGFIGSFVANKFLEKGVDVVGLDNLNDYYDVKLKEQRIKKIQKKSSLNCSRFIFQKTDLQNKEDLKNIFKTYRPKYVLNMAAQAGVRNSIENPHEFVQSNLLGFSTLIEEASYAVKKDFTLTVRLPASRP